MFPTGYRSSDVFDGGWNCNKEKWKGSLLTPEESLYVWESYGLDPYESCTDKEEFLKLLERKDNMNLTISMWKDEKEPWLRYVLIQDLVREYPLDWLISIGIVPKGFGS